MKEFLKNLFSKSETKDSETEESNIVELENKCPECQGFLCYDKSALKPLTEKHSEAPAFCKECGNDKFYVRVSENMVTVFHK